MVKEWLRNNSFAKKQRKVALRGTVLEAPVLLMCLAKLGFTVEYMTNGVSSLKGK